MSVDYEPLAAGDQVEAVRALARAFVTNPLHVAAFGAGALKKNEAFFRLGLAAMRGQKVVAKEGSRVLGVAHWVRAPGCVFTGGQRLSLLPGMVGALGMGPALKLRKWLDAWEKLHPVEPHLHLGPIGVSPEAQGRHIGHGLMEMFCAEADRTGTLGYLETDRAENTTWYERFGFETFHVGAALRVENYFMKRAPRRVKPDGWQLI